MILPRADCPIAKPFFVPGNCPQSTPSRSGSGSLSLTEQIPGHWIDKRLVFVPVRRLVQHLRSGRRVEDYNSAGALPPPPVASTPARTPDWFPWPSTRKVMVIPPEPVGGSARLGYLNRRAGRVVSSRDG